MTSPRVDWQVLGTHESGALLVRRAGGIHDPMLCCPRCFQRETLRGTITCLLLELEHVLVCPECMWRVRRQRDPGTDGVRLFASVDGGKWHRLLEEDGRFLKATCGARILRQETFEKAWGAVPAGALCSHCRRGVVAEYGKDALEGAHPPENGTATGQPGAAAGKLYGAGGKAMGMVI